ncbi:MAG: tRNA (adenosine(37)-N6)-threonylcarbamoyltransferase complex ATPase subunit type 1 TsaE [Cytophagales bacterium]
MAPAPYMRKCTIEKMEGWDKVAAILLQQAKDQQTWYFKGPIGAGKTTLIQAICGRLGVEEEVTSPTFSLVHEYYTKEREPIYHFDFYRLEDAQEVISIGLEDYLAQGKYLFIEWPDILSDLAMPSHFEIKIEPSNPSQRKLQWAHIKQAL